MLHIRDASIEEKKRKREEKEKKDAEKPSSRKKESILQAKLEKMALQIGYGGTIVAVLTVVVLFVRYFIDVRKTCRLGGG